MFRISLLKVAYPHCATCFGRCYPGGSALILEAKNLFDGIGRLLTLSPSRELTKPTNNGTDGRKSVPENGDMPKVENGVNTGIERTGSASADESTIL